MTTSDRSTRWSTWVLTCVAVGALMVGHEIGAAPDPQTARSIASGREGQTPLERTDDFLAQSRFRRLPSFNAKGEDTIVADHEVRLSYEFADDGAPGTEEELTEQLQGIVLAARFAQTPEETAEVRKLARRFSIVWSGSTNEYLSERRVSLGRAIEQLLTRRVARIRVAARSELATLVSERRGDFRRQFHLTRGDLEEQVIQGRGVLRDQWHRSLHQLASTIREQTHTFHASSFEELERVHWEERRGCRPDAPLDTYDQRLTRADQTIGETRGRAVFELLAAVSVPRQSMEASVRQAEDRSDRALRTALESLGSVESEVDTYLDRKLAEYARDLDGVITLPSSAPTTGDLLQLSMRVGGLLESAATSMVSTMRTRWMSKPRSILTDLDKTLRTERRSLLQTLRTEVNSFEETVVARVRTTNLEVEEKVRAAQRDFRAFGNEYALLSRANLDEPLEGLPLAASHTRLGYELESGLRLSFAQKWAEQRGEDLDRQFRLIVLLHRFTRADGVTHDAVRRVVDNFNTVWTRSDVSRRDVKKLEGRIAALLGKASALAKKGAIVGIESEIIGARIHWRRSYTQAVANLRATAAQSANSELTGTPTEAVRLQQVVAQEAARLIQLREEFLGELERAYWDAGAPGATTDSPETSGGQTPFQRYESARSTIQEQFEATVTEFRRGGTERFAEAREALSRRQQESRVTLTNGLEALKALDDMFEQRATTARDAAIRDLEASWDEIENRSVYQFDQLLTAVRDLRIRVGIALDSRDARRELSELAASHRAALENSESDGDAQREYERYMASRRAEVQADARYTVREAIRSLQNR
ncbi:MAG: hypothetical protein AAF488_08315 [Planctomycetota bacterium]